MSPKRCHDAGPSAADTRRPPRRWQPIRLLVGALVIAVALGGVASGSVASTASSTATEPTIVVSDATVDPDATETHRISLTDVPDGLAGFELTLALEEDDVGSVTNASYPDRFGMTTDPVASADGQTITVEAVDLTDEITSGAADVTLATVDVTGTESGETKLRVTEVQVDADGGSAIEPSLEAGTVTVGDGGSPRSASRGDGSETDSASDDAEDSVPGFAVGTAVVAIAAVATVPFARRT